MLSHGPGDAIIAVLTEYSGLSTNAPWFNFDSGIDM